MKKLLSLILTLTLALCLLCSCAPKPYEFKREGIEKITARSEIDMSNPKTLSEEDGEKLLEVL